MTKDFHCSDRSVLKVATSIRCVFGRSEQKTILNDFFSQCILQFEVKCENIELDNRPFSYCHDMNGLVRYLQSRWKKEDICDAVIGMDGGKNVLKMTIHFPGYPAVVIGAVPNVPESYFNCQIFFRYIDISMLSFKISTNLKLANIITGLTSSASRYPCLFGRC